MDNLEREQKFGTKEIIGSLILFGAMSEFIILNPCIATFALHFEGTPMTTIMFANTICGVVSVPVGIIAGALLPKVGYKPAALLGMLVMAVGGAFPFFMPDMSNYMYVIVSRVIVGIGLGIMFPVGPATIIAFTEGKQRAMLLGFGPSVQFVFSWLYTIAAGYLCEVSWNYSFLAYLLVLIPFVIALICMPEAKYIVRARAAQEEASSKNVSKAPVPKAIWGYAFLGLIIWLCMATIQMQGSSIFMEHELGNPGFLSVIMSFCGLGFILSGLCYGICLKVLKKWIFPLSAFLLAVGFIPCFMANNAYAYGAGLLLIGWGCNWFFTACQNAAANITPKERTAFVSGIMTAMMNLGPFFGPYLIASSTSALAEYSTTAVCIVCIVIGVVWGILTIFLPLKSIKAGNTD